MYAAPIYIKEFALSDCSIFFNFLFLILLVRLLYRSGSLNSAFLLSFFTIRFLTTFLPNLIRLPRPFPRYWLTHRQRRLPFGAALTGYDFKCTFAMLNLLWYFAVNVLLFDSLTFFGLASVTITKLFSYGEDSIFFQSKNERITLIN